MKKNGITFFIFGAFMLNFFLKLFKIDIIPYSYDEIISVKNTLLDFGHIKHESEWDSNPPFYYYCLWIWEKLFGISEFAIRSFSAFFNSLTILTLGFFLNKIFNKYIVIFFTFLFIFHPTLLFYSQEARCYSLLIFLISVSIISLYYFVLKDNFLNLLFLGCINFLLIYTHYISTLIIPFQFLFCLIFYKKTYLKFILSGVLTLALIWLRFTKKQLDLILGITSNSIKETWIQKASFNNLLDFFNTMYGSYFIFLLIITVALFFMYKNKELKLKNTPIIYFFIFISFLLPVLFYLIGCVTPIFINRYILYTVPFFLIIVAIILNQLKKLGYIIFTLLLTLEITNIKFGESKGIDYKNAAAFVKKIKNKPLVIINKKDLTGVFTYYYNIEIFKKMKYNSKDELNKNNIFDANTLADFKSIDLTNQKVIMLFQTFDKENDNVKINEWFKSNHYLLNSYHLFEGVKFTFMKKE